MSNEKVANYAALGEAVRNAREESGFSQRELTLRGGPSDTTLGQIESGTWTAGPGRSASTLRKLDRGFGWPPGTAAAVLSGDLPPLEPSKWGEPDPPEDEDPLRVARNRFVHGNGIAYDQVDPLLALLTVRAIQLEERVEDLSQRLQDAERVLLKVPELAALWLETPTRDTGSISPRRRTAAGAPSRSDEFLEAARDTGTESAGQRRRREHDQAGEPPADDPNNMEPS